MFVFYCFKGLDLRLVRQAQLVRPAHQPGGLGDKKTHPGSDAFFVRIFLQTGLPDAGGRVLRGCLQCGRHTREEVESGPGLNSVDRGSVHRVFAGVRLVGVGVVDIFVLEYIGAALGGGNVPGSIEGTHHNALVEVARDLYSRNIFGSTFEEGSRDNIKGVSPARCGRLDLILQIVPNGVVEMVLPLGSLVGIVECLFVLVDSRLAIVGRHKMTFAVGSGNPGLLPIFVERGVISPTLLPADIVVSPQRCVHHMCRPDGGFLVAVEHHGVVPDILAVARLESVCRDGAGRIGRVVAVPLVVLGGVVTVCPGPGKADFGNFKAGDVAQVGRCAFSIGSECQLFTFYGDIVAGFRILHIHDRLIVIFGRRGEAGDVN